MIRFSGRLRSALIIGGQGIRARKMRTLLSILSLFLGVLAIVVVQAAAESIRAGAVADAELHMGKDGTLETYLPTEGKGAVIAMDAVKGRANVVLSSTTLVTIGEPGVTAINQGGAPFEHSGGPGRSMPDGGKSGFMCDQYSCWEMDGPRGQVKPPGQAVDLNLMAMTGDIRQFRPFRPVSGAWLDFSGPASLAPGIVLNKDAAKFFNAYQIPAEMTIPGATANMTPRILGVVDDGMGQPFAYVRMDELANWLPPGGSNRGGGLQLLLAPQAADVVQVLKTRLVADGNQYAAGIQAQPINSQQQVESQLSLIRFVFLGVAALVLLIGVAGILNVGLATVGERVEEFALRRAVGTPRSLLAGIVLAETLLTGMLTAAAAIGVAAVGLQFAGRFLDGVHPALGNISFPLQAGIAGVAAGLIAGLLGGLVPAIRAARIPIATVMRA